MILKLFECNFRTKTELHEMTFPIHFARFYNKNEYMTYCNNHNRKKRRQHVSTVIFVKKKNEKKGKF